jgi:hypothetical protein
MTNYGPPWSARSTFLGDLARNALLESPRPRSTFLGEIARNGFLEAPKPVTLGDALSAFSMLKPSATEADIYLRRILRREAVDTSPASPLRRVQATLAPVIWKWANGYLLSVEPSGSFSKGTANAGRTDIDLFISVSPDVTDTLSEIYEKLDRALKTAGYKTRRQNVSININVAGHSVDLVPARRQNLMLEDHWLYRRKIDSRTKTNVGVHALLVAHSGRTEEIRIVKLWRDQWGLDWPSFYLELTVLRALGTFTPYNDLAANVSKVFDFLRDEFAGTRIMDPANTNNIISEDLTSAEKRKISAAAAQARATPYWNDIVV